MSFTFDSAGIAAPERNRTLLITNVLVGALCLAYVAVLHEVPGVQPFEYAMFAGSGCTLLLLAGLRWRGWLPYLFTAWASVGLALLLLFERLLMIFIGPLLDTPGQTVFMPVFSYYVLVYIVVVVLLPYPMSAYTGVAAWIAMAVFTTALSRPHWSAPPPLLAALLTWVWMGHGTFVLLIFSAARMQQRLVQAEAESAAAERAARERAQQAEAERERQQQILQFHLQNTPMAMIEWTPDLRVRGWSRRAEEIFGWTASEVLGKGPLDWHFIHDDDRAAVDAVDSRIFDQHERLVVSHNRNYRKDGSVVHCCWYNSILRDERGEVLSFLSLVDDVSDEQEAAQRLRESETLLRGVFEQAGVGIALIDAGGRWLSANQRLCELTGYTEAELKRLDSAAITHPDDRVRHDELVRRMLRGDIPGYRLEKRYRRKDGGEVWVVLNARRIEALPGSPVHYLKVIEDIGDLKATEARVQALNASLEVRVGQRTAQLREAIDDAERRGRDLGRVAEMTGLLAGARDLGEAMKIIAHAGRQLFPDTEVALYLASDEPERFVLREHWGEGVAPVAGFTPSDCWAVRRGREHRVEDHDDRLRCSHHANGAGHRPQTCLPLVALGETVGVLTLNWSFRPDGWAPDPLLLRSLAEQAGLAVGNVRLREELRRHSVQDPVTGLGNREQLEEQLRRRMAEQARGGRGFALLRLDIEGYGGLMDRFGAEAAEGLLREVADLLRIAARAEEPLFRHGPGEFALVLVTDEAEQVTRAAQRLQAKVEGLQLSPRGQPLPPLMLAAGHACCPADAASPTDLLQRADEALRSSRLRRREPKAGEDAKSGGGRGRRGGCAAPAAGETTCWPCQPRARSSRRRTGCPCRHRPWCCRRTGRPSRAGRGQRGRRGSWYS